MYRFCCYCTSRFSGAILDSAGACFPPAFSPCICAQIEGYQSRKAAPGMIRSGLSRLGTIIPQAAENVMKIRNSGLRKFEIRQNQAFWFFHSLRGSLLHRPAGVRKIAIDHRRCLKVRISRTLKPVPCRVAASAGKIIPDRTLAPAAPVLATLASGQSSRQSVSALLLLPVSGQYTAVTLRKVRLCANQLDWYLSAL